MCTGFVGPCPLLPVRAGEIQCRCLGARVEAYDPEGRSVVDQVGELVIAEPMPSVTAFLARSRASAGRAATLEAMEDDWCLMDAVSVPELMSE